MLILPEVGIESNYPLGFIFTTVLTSDDDTGATVAIIASSEILHQIFGVERFDGNLWYLVSAFVGCFVIHLLIPPFDYFTTTALPL